MGATEMLKSMLDTLTGPGTPFTVGDIEVDGRAYKGYTAAPPETRLIWLANKAADDDDYLVYEDERITYGDARVRVLEVANALIDEYGVQPGDSVGIAMRNYPEWVLAFWAIQVAGAAAVEMNAFWNGEELTYGITDSACRILFCDQQRHDSLQPHLDQISGAGIDLQRIVVRADTDLSEKSVQWESVTGPSSVPAVTITPDTRSAIVYTSGTTAFPKGVVHSQRNVVTNLLNLACMGIAFNMAEVAARGGDPATASGSGDTLVMLVAVPLFHVTGSHCVMVPITAGSGTLVLMHKWDPERALELIEREKVTNFTGVPTMTMDMLASPDFEKRDTSSIKSMSSGGSSNPPHMVDKVNASMENATAGQGYGLSEVSGIATANMGMFYAEKPGSAGLQPRVSEMKVVDENNVEVPLGDRGELLIRGPHVFTGYHNKPAETADAIDADGWFRSGDIATIDEDGFVFIVDRAKDIVIRGGENVGSAEVEAVIARHECVHECAVFGLPHERLGEEVAVAVYPASGKTIDVAELITFAAAHLAAFKVPSQVYVYDHPLPKNANGKILKRQLREEAAPRSAP